MAEEITNEAIVEESPMAEAPLEVPQEESASIETTSPPDDDKFKRMQAVYKMLDSDAVYYKYVPKTFDEFITKIGSDVKYAQGIHKMVASDEVYSKYIPETFEETVQYFGLGKPSAVPSASVGGGSATRGRGVEQPSTLPPRKSSEVEQSVMGYALPKTIEIGGGKANVEEELRLPTEAEFGAIEKMPLTKEAKLEEAVKLGTPPVQRATQDIKSNKAKILTSEEELTKLDKELAQYKQQSDSLLAMYNNEQLSPEERNKAGQEYNKVNEVAKPIEDKRNELYGNYQGYINNQKVLFNELDKAEKMRQKGLEKEYSYVQNLIESTGSYSIKALTGIGKMSNMISMVIAKPFGLMTPQEERLGVMALDASLGEINKFADSLITQEVPENYKKLFDGEFSVGKLAYITTNAVASTIPTIAAGLVTGGAGSLMVGAGIGFEESKNIMKDAGLNDEQANWAAFGLAIPIGFLEKYGADDAVRLLNGSGIRRQVATELARKVAGKTLSREALFLEARKTLGEVIKAKTGRILASGGKESLTEVSQGELQELTKQVVQEFTGVDKDENMSTRDYVIQQLKQRGEEAVGGFLGGTSMAGVGVAFNSAINKQEFSPSAYTKAMEFADPAKFQQFQNDLMLEVQNGVLTEEQANEAIANVQAIQETNALIPNSVQNLDLRTDAVNLIIERNNIAKEIEGKDPDLIINEKTRLAEIKKSLNEIALGNKPSVAEQQAAIETAPAPPSEAAQEERKVKTLEDEINVGDTVDLTPRTPTTTSENQVSIENRSRKDLFPDETEFADVIGGSGQSSKISSYREVNGIGISEYTNPENGLVDVIMTGTSDNDYVGYVRIYENGKPTNRWTSKMENKSGNKANFKTMINEVKKSLPEGHEYTEKTNISLDGLRVFAKNLQKGYEYLRDKAGDIVTNNVELNNATLEKLRGAKTEDEVAELYERKTGITRDEFNKIKEKVESILPNTRLIFNETNGSVIVRLPVLVSTSTTEQAPQPTPTTEPQAPVAELSKVKDEVNNAPITDRDNNNQDVVRYIPFAIIEAANKNDKVGGQTAREIVARGGYSVGELNRLLPNWREMLPQPQAPVAEEAKGEEKPVAKKEIDEEEIVSYNPTESIKDKDMDTLNKVLTSKKISPQAEPQITDFGDTVVFEYNNMDEGDTKTRITFKRNKNGTLNSAGVKVEENTGSIRGSDFYAKYIASKEATSEQAPQPFPAQEGAESAQEQEFKANPELEQIYRDLNAAVTKNVDKDTIRMLKENPTEAMVEKALRELQKKGIINIEC